MDKRNQYINGAKWVEFWVSSQNGGRWPKTAPERKALLAFLRANNVHSQPYDWGLWWANKNGRGVHLGLFFIGPRGGKWVVWADNPPPTR